MKVWNVLVHSGLDRTVVEAMDCALIIGKDTLYIAIAATGEIDSISAIQFPLEWRH